MSRKMRFSDLEIGDKLIVNKSIERVLLLDGCGCSYCAFFRRNINKELLVSEVLKIEEDTIRIILIDSKNNKMETLVGTEFDTAFRISHVVNTWD